MFEGNAVVSAILRSVGQRKLQCKKAPIMIKRQVVAWDRIVSIPAKVVMEILTAEDVTLEIAPNPCGARASSTTTGTAPSAQWQVDVE